MQPNYEITVTQFPLKYMKCIVNKIPYKFDSFFVNFQLLIILRILPNLLVSRMQ